MRYKEVREGAGVIHCITDVFNFKGYNYTLKKNLFAIARECFQKPPFSQWAEGKNG